MNAKVILKALKATLSALLYEQRLVIIKSERLDFPKTKLLSGILQNFNRPTPKKLLFVTPLNTCKNFKIAAKNISNVKVVNIKEFNVKIAIKSDYTFITKQALKELEMKLETDVMSLYRNRTLPRPEFPYDKALGIKIKKSQDFFQKVALEMENFKYDPEKEVEIYTESLQGYLEKAEVYAKEKAKMHDTEDIMFVNKSE